MSNSEETWSCHVCTLENPSNRKRCDACNARRAVSSSTTTTPNNNVRSWLHQRRNKRKRSPTVRVRIRLEEEQWEPLQARLSQNREASVGNDGQQNVLETVNRNVDPTIQSLSTFSMPTGTSRRQAEAISEIVDAKQCFGFASAAVPQRQQDYAKHLIRNVLSCAAAAETSPRRQADHETGLENIDPQETSATLALPTRQEASSGSGNYQMDLNSNPADTNQSAQSPNAAVVFEDSGSEGKIGKHFRQNDGQSSAINAAQRDEGNRDSRLDSNASHSSVSMQTEKTSVEVMQCDQHVCGGTVGDEANVLLSPSFEHKEVLSSLNPSRENEIGNVSGESRSSERLDSANVPDETSGDLPDIFVETNAIGSHDVEDDHARPSLARHYNQKDDVVDDNTPSQDEAVVNDSTSSQDEAVDIGFSQLMSQQPCGFLYSQMTQAEPDFDVAPHVDSIDHDTIKKGRVQPACAGSTGGVDETKLVENDDLRYIQEKASASKNVPPSTVALQSHLTETATIQLPMPGTSGAGSCIQFPEERQSEAPFSARISETDCLLHSTAAFKTVGKECVISLTEKNSMVRAPALLQDDSNDHTARSDILYDAHFVSNRQPVAMFKTAGKESVLSVSEDSLAYAKALLQDTSSVNFEEDKNPSPRVDPPLPTKIPQLAAEFHTTGKRTLIPVIEDSLNKAGALLEGPTAADTVDHTTHFQGFSSISAGRLQSVPMFQTAGKGNVISITEESMSLAATLLEVSSANTRNAELDVKQPSRGVLSSSSSACVHPTAIFQTAGKGSVISVTEESMSQAATLLTDTPSSVDTEMKKESGPNYASIRGGVPHFAAAFQTAGKGIVISVTEESLARAGTLLQDSTATVAAADDIKSLESESTSLSLHPLSMSMFHAACKGSMLRVSENSMARATSLLQEAPTASSFSIGRSCSLTGIAPIAASFQTAGRGTTIRVSEDSLKRASELLEEAPTTDACNEKSFQVDHSFVTKSAPTFQAAGTRTAITVTEGCVRRTTALLQNLPSRKAEADVEASSLGILPSTPNTFSRSTTMFQTAGKGNTIHVTEENMVRAAALLNDAPAITEKTDGKESPRYDASVRDGVPASAASFQMAKKASILSEPEDSSLDRASALLQECCVTGTKIHGHSWQHEFSVVSKPPPSVPQCQMAGKRTTISITDDGSARARALLDDDQTVSIEPDLKHPSRDVASDSECHGLSMFQTARKRSVIPASEEGIARAKVLRQEEKTFIDEVMDRKALPHRDISVLDGMPRPTVTNQNAGRGTAISVMEGKIARADAMWQNSTDVQEQRHKSQTGSSKMASTEASMPMFQTAGKKSLIAVTEDSFARAATMLQDDWTTTSEVNLKRVPRDIFYNQTPMFQTAGKRSVLSEESVARANTLLHGASTAPCVESENEGLSQRASSARSDVSQSVQGLQTAGKGMELSVSEDNTIWANELVQEIYETDTEEQRKRTQSTNEVTAKKMCLSDTLHPDHTLDCLVDATVDEEGFAPNNKTSASEMDATTVCAARGQKNEHSQPACASDLLQSNCEFANQSSQDLITQPLPPETPLLRNRRLQLEHSHEDSLRIRTVAFGLTPQSPTSSRGSSSRTCIPYQLQSQDIFSEHIRDSMNHAYPAVTPSSHVGAKMPKSNTLPAFTPKQTPMETANAVVTMSIDPKNPYLRKRQSNPSNDLNEKDAYSPVPIYFRHVEGNFRGEPVSPSSISCAQTVFAGIPKEASNETLKALTGPVTGKSGVSTAPSTSQAKKLVTWSQEKRNAEQLPVRNTLSEFASNYGRMDDCADACRDAGVHAVTIAVDSSNASRVRFDPESGQPCSFFGQPCLPNCKPVGSVKDLRESLVKRGCDDKILSDKWISNHCRWIVWKLASTERRFSHSLAQSYFTYEHVISQLHQRYDKEIIDGTRSALRKVLNRDVAPNTMMILCVSQIVRSNKSGDASTRNSKQSEYMLELTDGWYAIGCGIDSSLSALVSKDKIKVGSKLLICNAKLEGSEDGIDPLDSSYSSSGRNCSAALCLFANGTRLAKWDAKLGFIKPRKCTLPNRGSLLVRSISDIIPGGGNVPLINVVVCRLYPRMFLERRGTGNPDDMLEKLVGKSPVISETQEYKNRMNFEKKRQQAIERLYETVQNDCAKVRY